MISILVESVNHLLTEVKAVLDSWQETPFAWFRGEPKSTPTPLLPKVFRHDYPENTLLQLFRMKAPMLGLGQTPPKGNTDEWLFLAQHMGLPTRLLDWTESLLVATHFSLLEHQKRNGAIVWMLNPSELNRIATGSTGFDLTWFSPELDVTAWVRTLLEPDKRLDKPKLNYLVRAATRLRSSHRPRVNFANINIRGAWENDRIGTQHPVAIYPASVHPRMVTQKSCFTIHRKQHLPLANILNGANLVRFEIPDSDKAADSFRNDLRLLGMTTSTVYPDLSGLAKELDELCLPRRDEAKSESA